MDRKKVLLLIRIILLAVFMIVTAYLYFNRRNNTETGQAVDNSSVMRHYMMDGLTIEGPSRLGDGLSVAYYGPDSAITREALKKADMSSGVLSAIYYEINYTPREEGVSADAAAGEELRLMCSAALKNDMASDDGELRIYRVEGKNATLQKMFIKEKDPAWISEGTGNYLLVRLYPEELLIAEAEPEEPEPTEPEEPEATPTPTPTPKPKPTPTPLPENDDRAPGFYSTADLNVRQTPDRGSRVLGVVKSGAPLEGVEATEDPEWYKVVFKGETGYVSAQYVMKKD